MMAHTFDALERKAEIRPAFDPASADMTAIVANARALRARYIGAWTSRAVKALIGAWLKNRQYRRAYLELQTFTDSELHDIGLNRAEIKFAVYGRTLPLHRRIGQAVTAAVRTLFAGIADWHRRQQTFVELNSLDDHVLRDIGVARGDIANVVYGGNDYQGLVANTNQPRTAA